MSKIRIGITMGDPSGIGAAIIAKAIKEIKFSAELVVIGDRWVFDKSRDRACPCPLSVETGRDLSVKSQKFRFVDLNNVPRKDFKFGKIRAEYGRASVEYLDKAMDLIKKNEIDSLVTAPISKQAVNLAGFRFAGHTEYLEERTQTKNTVMMLSNKRLRFSLVTRHIPLEDVASRLNKEELYKTILITYQSLRTLFLIKEPRIVVCGLNPHASDNGIIGGQENRIIKPVIKRFKKNIRYIEGPLSSDIAVKRAFEKKYDCAIAMYHDQALIPLKLSDSCSGVNLTLGLPFIRTSPLHGTAFDIAAVTLADPRSLIEAIRLNIICASNQRRV
ncbi:MAG: 4-hydroxythreonine-4-phosphate dehydrogenase PdxA [Candidatus Omnitrophota bacterium]